MSKSTYNTCFTRGPFYGIGSHCNRVMTAGMVTLENSGLSNTSNCIHVEDQAYDVLVCKLSWDINLGNVPHYAQLYTVYRYGPCQHSYNNQFSQG